MFIHNFYPQIFLLNDKTPTGDAFNIFRDTKLG